MRAPAILSRATPAVQAASAWFSARSRREQVLLSALALLVAIALLWLLILRPLLDAREASIARIAAYEGVMVRVRTAGPIGSATGLSGPLQNAIPTQAATFGVIPTVTADGEDAASLTVSEGRYESVVPWLASLERAGVVLSEVRIERGSNPGAVNLTARAER